MLIEDKRPTYVKGLRVEEWYTHLTLCWVLNVTCMYPILDYMTRMCAHNFSIALITFIPYMQEYLSMFLNETLRMNLMKQASAFEKDKI